MRKLLTLLVSLLAIAAPASAQITTPFTFTAGTVANPDEVNSNFAKFADALNRTGGTMSGTLTAQQITPSASNTYDLGSAAALFRSEYLRTSLVFGQAAGNYTLTWANPAAARAISIADPGGTDVFTFNAATQTLTNKTLTAPAISAPVLSGTATGTYTLAGTPTITAPAISSPVLSGSATGTYTLAGTPTITSPTISGPTLSGTVIGTYTIGGTPTFPATVPLTTAANVFTANQTITTASDPLLIFLTTPAADGPGAIQFNTSNTVKNWQIGDNLVTSGALTFTPSTANGGTTYTTPVLTIASTGLMTSAASGLHNFNGNTNGSHGVILTNSSAGASAAAFAQVSGDTSSGLLQQASSGYTGIASYGNTFTAVRALGSGGLMLGAEHASGVIKFFTGGTTLRGGFNAAGDFLLGGSGNIAFSTGTPTITSGFGTGPAIAGNDYAFRVTMGTTPANGVIAFGHTWSNIPSCSIGLSSNNLAGSFVRPTPTTSGMAIDFATLANIAVGDLVYIHCSGR